MANANAAAPREMIELGKNQWTAFLAEFTRQNRGAHARLEVLDSDIGDQIEAKDRTFDGVSVDVKDGEKNLWITLGSTPADHLAHGIHNVTAIRVLPPTTSAGAVMEVEAQNGTKTLLELTRPEDYALPPAK
jgi:hypothetical protein